MSAPASPTGRYPDLAGYYSRTLPDDAYGTITAALTVPTTGSCPIRAIDDLGQAVIAHAAGGLLILEATIRQSCDNGQPAQPEGFVEVGGTTRFLIPTPSPGDEVKVAISDHVGVVNATLDDLNSKTSVHVAIVEFGPLADLEIGDLLNHRPIPSFTRTRFTDVTFQGQPISNVPRLTKSEVPNSGDKPLVQVADLSSTGRNFWLIFRHPG
jgi:hypothetical protein